MATDTLASPATLGSSHPTKVFKNFIDGEWVESSTGETFENRNPANTRDVVGVFQKSAKADVDAAVDAAKRAFAKWRLVPAPRRAEIVFRAAEILVERKEEYAREMTREMGKVLAETRGDVQEAIDAAYYNAGGTPPLRSHGAVGDAQQVRHGGAPANRRLRHDNAVEFPYGDFFLEAAARHRLRKHMR